MTAGTCLLCGRRAAPGALFDSDLCRDGWRETRRRRYAQPAGKLPPALLATLERLLRGEDVPAADENALLARYQRPQEHPRA